MPELSLSSWAVHGWVGDTFDFSPGDLPPTGVLDRLLKLPRRAKEAGFTALEVCDFHLLPDRIQLERFRHAADEAGIKLFQLLIDHGDITHPTDAEASLDYIEAWIRFAAVAGFERVRVIAGKQVPTSESIDKAVAGLTRLRATADKEGVGISTENWHALMASPQVVIEVLQRTGLGLVFDFGNWTGPDKMANLTEIVPFATSCHAKCHYAEGRPLVDDFVACLKLVKEERFEGYFTLVHPEMPDEWAALEDQVAVINQMFNPITGSNDPRYR